MAVVINDFEVLPAAPAPARAPQAGAAADETAPKEKPEPCAVAAALHTLHAQSLRAWAH
jgi:hypothetical protein